MSEFLLFIVPLINVRKAKTFLRRTFGFDMHADDPDAEASKSCPVRKNVILIYHVYLLQICNTKPIYTPYVASCGHVFCYYCLAGSLKLEGNRFQCPRCAKQIRSMKRFEVRREKGRGKS